LKLERNDATDKEQHFEKELAIAQKLASLYKSNCEKRTTEAAQLESVVRDLRKHVEVRTQLIEGPTIVQLDVTQSHCDEVVITLLLYKDTGLHLLA